MEVSEKTRRQLVFFGITPESAAQIRYNLFDLIDEMVIASNGSYSWNDIYNMPIWLRSFTYNKMKARVEKQTAQTSSTTNKKTLVNPDGTINKEAFKEANNNMKGKINYK